MMFDELVNENKQYTHSLKERYKTNFDDICQYLQLVINLDQIPESQEIIFPDECMTKERLEEKVRRNSIKENGAVTTNYWPLVFLAINYTSEKYNEEIKMAFAESLDAAPFVQFIDGRYCGKIIDAAKHGKDMDGQEISKENFEHLLLCYLAVDKVLKQENFFETISWNIVPGMMYWTYK